MFVMSTLQLRIVSASGVGSASGFGPNHTYSVTYHCAYDQSSSCGTVPNGHYEFDRTIVFTTDASGNSSFPIDGAGQDDNYYNFTGGGSGTSDGVPWTAAENGTWYGLQCSGNHANPDRTITGSYVPPGAITYTISYVANGTNLDFSNSEGPVQGTLTAAGGDYIGRFDLPGGASFSATTELVGGSPWTVSVPGLVYGIRNGVSEQVDLSVTPSTGSTPSSAGVVQITITANWHSTASPSPTASVTPTPTPTSSPTPTPTATSSPTPTPTPFPTSSPASTPPPGPPNPPQDPALPPPTAGAGGGATTRYGDVYSDVRQGMNDSGNQDTGSPQLNSDFDTGDQPTGSDGNQSSDIQGAADGLKTSADNLKNTGIGKIGELQALNLPTSIGQKSTWNITLPGPLASHPFVVDMAAYSGTIGALRALCLMGVFIAAWFVSVNIIRSGIG